MEVTIDHVRTAVRALDLTGRCLCIHASLRSFGRVDGGALTVIMGLLREGCTLLVPACSWSAFAVAPMAHQLPERNGGSAQSWRAYFASLTAPLPGTSRVYTADTPEIDSEMGAIPAAVVAMPGRARGNHPLFSFAAVGPLAQKLIADQSPLNVYGPLKTLLEHEGFVVLMGVDLTSTTLLHLAEEVAGRNLFRRWANGPNGQPMEVTVGGCSMGFEKLASLLAPLERVYSVGESQWRVYPAQEMVAHAVQAIQKDSQVTHCGDMTCDRCHDAVCGGPVLTNRSYLSSP